MDNAAQATLVFAVRSGRISIEEACRVYKLSVDEFLAWERNLERYGIPGLRTTRYQIYRDDERSAGRAFERFGNQPGASSLRDGQGCRTGHPAYRKHCSAYIAKKR